MPMLDREALEQQVREQMQKHELPGMALAVVHGGEITYANGFGVTSVEDGGQPVTPQTLFRVGSTSKPLTGTAIMRLVEAGVLELDKPVSHYLPDFQFSQAEDAADKVTLRMLLSHTSGLSSVAASIGSRDPQGLAECVRTTIAHLPFLAPPGKVYAYSNPGLTLAGYIACVATGKGFSELMQEQLFGPAGMERTTFDPLVAMTYPLALPHERAEDGALRVAHRFHEHTGFHPAGFAMSTVTDLARFAILQMNGGRIEGQQVLSPESIREMHAQQTSYYDLKEGGYGLTFMRERYKGLTRVEHGGGIHTYHAALDMLPEANTAVVILSNRVAPPGVLLGIINGIFDQLLGLEAVEPAPPEAIEPDRSLWPRYTGTYLCKWRGLATVRATAAGLEVDYGYDTHMLEAYTPEIYFAQPGFQSFGFVPEAEGPSRFLMAGRWLLTRFDLDRAFQPDPTVLASLAGTYSAADGEEIVRLRVEEGRLTAQVRWSDWKDAPCTMLNSHDRFATPAGLFEVAAGAGGEPELIFNGWRMTRS